MELNTTKDLIQLSLKDIHSAEEQIIKALPLMIEKTKNEPLRSGFEQHLEETKVQLERLEKVGAKHDIALGGHKCVGMEGIIQEGSEILNMDGEAALKDSAIIGAAQKVEHYEISAYGTLIALFTLLEDYESANLMKESLTEEERTDEKLTKLAESEINLEAIM